MRRVEVRVRENVNGGGSIAIASVLMAKECYAHNVTRKDVWHRAMRQKSERDELCEREREGTERRKREEEGREKSKKRERRAKRDEEEMVTHSSHA